MKIFESTCNKLNKILENRPEKQDEFIAKINEIIDKEVFGCNGGLYNFIKSKKDLPLFKGDPNKVRIQIKNDLVRRLFSSNSFVYIQ